jgi:DNA-binding CsgD family transcriptional regulator
MHLARACSGIFCQFRLAKEEGSKVLDDVIPEAGIKKKIYRLWDELSDFEVSQTDAAAHHLKESLCRMVGAWNATWGGAVRIDAGRAADPLQGWRVATTRLLYPTEPYREDGPFKEILAHWDRRETDPSFLLPMREVGRFRAYAFRRDLPPDWFDSRFYRAYYSPFGTADAVFVGFPLSTEAESHFGFYSHTAFTDRDIALLAYALRGIKWFHRQVMLTHGPLIAKSPLTPTERRVLGLLLTKASEKQVAEQLGLAVSTTHQHVVALFRKFAVRSRAELMSLWLTRPN